MKDPAIAEVVEGNECIAYIQGFVDGKGPTYKAGCFIGFSTDEMATVYLEYMQKHADYLPMSRRLALDEALTTKFCPDWKEPPASK